VARDRYLRLKRTLLLALLGLPGVLGAVGSAAPALAQTVWNGPTTSFAKANFADHTLPENQDAIASGVAITRANALGIFNIAVEESYEDGVSPADTEWAWTLNNPGLTHADIRADNYAALNFDDWVTAHSRQPLATVGIPGVLHIISLDIYIDVTFTAWTPFGGGGGFAYDRSTPPVALPAVSGAGRALCAIALACVAARKLRARGRGEAARTRISSTRASRFQART
jgi:hypothetical protein